MLNTPAHGWSRIVIGDWSDRCSYIDDVPFVLLDKLSEACEKGNALAVFDAEGWEYKIVFGTSETHIITEADDSFRFETQGVGCYKLAMELVEDIQRNIDAWSDWFCNVETDKEITKRKKALLDGCKALEKKWINV